ncbi:peptidase G2 autoproteolytic cleavage domain-containing protein [Phaeobacter gallaeciensis]|uniref:Peptidase G2 autoproteolytic cleavage domain-containing protein n=1 Tax=Phaeobacter gallaeciensis TaxID=60890 RepID=A0ABD4XG09_9RHOB|nr:peptidase G2 autoproteolytic cleavage domain-containing protein [Phaeobacter gallaeciensis]MDE4146923.1 peptidase G2 autoproteolytic cleavage domain-containing protein [Phaeobacter gallaeciensis]MDE4163772.1 peptidase G2 autoproteolytic cleavage domain-containing protein [Phaeobacter gallaeciensis]MDE4168007.1 peptidase G2 autoproteolytic cleavage domain-containing protein [Phaeobacter gallaeciensis]MDE4172239.1 peptidase G2 autoproteolytic cleavage domain-containing protein [Phaeobacter gal
MSYPEFSDFPPIPQRSAAEADFDTKMSALFQHFATTHRAELIALIDFLKTNSTIIGGALNATTVGLDTPAEGKFTDLTASGTIAVGTTNPATYGGDLVVVGDVLGGESAIVVSNTNSSQFARLGINGDTAQIAWDNADQLAFGTAASSDTSGLDNVFMSITSFGRVGFGTTSPAQKVHIDAGTDNEPIRVESSTSYCLVEFIDSGGTGAIGVVGGDPIVRVGGNNVYQYGVSSAAHVFRNGATENMRLDGTGNLGIGVSAVNAKVHALEDSGTLPGIRVDVTNASFGDNILSLNMYRAANSTADFLQAYSGNFADAEFRLRADGNGTCDGSWTGGGADYAEYFEWADTNPGEEDRRGLSVVLDGDKIRLALPGEDPIGVISANPSVVGDGDIDRWKGKYLRDDFGAYIWEDYEVLRWTETVTETEAFQEQASEAQERIREVVEVVNGQAVRKIVTETIHVPLFDEFPLVDGNGDPVMRQVQIGMTDPVLDEDGNEVEPAQPIYESQQVIHQEPRMVEVQKESTKEETHSYAADEVPDGVAVPADVERVTQRRRKLNPDYDPSLDYTPRADRPEWDTVGLMGKLRLLKGQPTGARWIKMRDVSADVEEWLVR